MKRICLLLLLIYAAQAQNTDINTSCKYLLSNSKELITEYSVCDSIKLKKGGFNCKGLYGRDKIISILKKSDKEISDQECEELITLYLNSLSWISYVRTESTLINDKISINFLIKLLPIKKNNFDLRAFTELNQNTTIDGLLRYKTELINSIAKCNPDNWEKKYLLALVADNIEEKNNLMRKETLPSQYKALLGDSLELKKMIATYRKESQWGIKRFLAEQLVFTQKPIAIKEVLNSFNSPIYEIDFSSSPPCTSQTLRRDIISAFKRYFPREEVYSALMRQIETSRRMLQDSLFTANLINQFAKIVKEKYDYNLTIPHEKYPLGQRCRDIVR